MPHSTNTQQQPAQQTDIARRMFGQFGIHTETLQAPQFHNTFLAVEAFEIPEGHGWNDHVLLPREGRDPNLGGKWFEEINDRGHIPHGCRLPHDRPSPMVESVWLSNSDGSAELRRIVVAPRAIDAMAHYQLQPDRHAAYVSVNPGSGLYPEQRDILEAQLKKLPAKGGELILAAGRGQLDDNFIEGLRRICPPTVTFKLEKPDRGLSWTDKLQQQERDWIRTQGLRPALHQELSR